MLPRTLSALTLSVFLMSGGTLMAQKALIKSKAEQCMQAIVRGDFEELTDLTYPPLVQLMGGKEQMVQLLGKTYATMQEQGFSFDSGNVENVARVVKTKHRSFAVVPYTLYITTSEGTISQEGSMVGVSENNGKSWTFVDLSNGSQALLPQLFPDEKNLAKALSLPPGEAPATIRTK